MPFVVDGSNLGGTLGGRRGARDATAVLALLIPWARARSRVVVVFDGVPQAHVADRYGPLQVRFSAPLSADAVIEHLVSGNPRDWWVATQDRELARRCTQRGAHHLAVSELLARTPERGRDGEKAKEPLAVDVADWEAYFRGEVE
jgi:hypothetical protein